MHHFRSTDAFRSVWKQIRSFQRQLWTRANALPPVCFSFEPVVLDFKPDFFLSCLLERLLRRFFPASFIYEDTVSLYDFALFDVCHKKPLISALRCFDSSLEKLRCFDLQDRPWVSHWMPANGCFYASQVFDLRDYSSVDVVACVSVLSNYIELLHHRLIGRQLGHMNFMQAEKRNENGCRQFHISVSNGLHQTSGSLAKKVMQPLAAHFPSLVGDLFLSSR